MAGKRGRNPRCPRCGEATFAQVSHTAARDVLLGGVVKARLTPVARFCSGCAHLWADMLVEELEGGGGE